MEYFIRSLAVEDREAVMDIFNHYVENSFAAYPERRLPYQAFDRFLEMTAGLPACALVGGEEKIVGFGMLRPHNPMAVFSHTAEITCFIHPAHTGKGLGKRLLAWLEKEGRERGVTTILASISSLNPGSRSFHQQNGFTQCGHFRQVGRKRGIEFDTIWMQKML